MRVKHYTVAHSIASTIDPPDNLMASPSGHPRDLVGALWTQSTLPKPETQKLLPALRAGFHLHVKPTLEVSFPTRIVRVSITLDLDVTDDRD